jgi:peptidoglycan/LPS O-acetylase OafA/YrhL
MHRIKELDGLRAIAIAGVLFSHFVHENSPLANFFRLGWAGVDLFFAISGFLITGILIDLRGREASFRTFYWRRTLRIFPPYYAALAITLALAILHTEQINYRAVAHHALFLSSVKPTLVKFAVLRFFFHAPVAAPVIPSPPIVPSLPHFTDGFEVYWSLSVEEFFYLIWAPILLKGSRRLVVLCSTVPLFVCPLLRGLAHSVPHIEESIGFVFRFDSLAAGGCIALLMYSIEKGFVTRKLFDRGLAATLGLAFLGLLVLGKLEGALHRDVRTTLPFSVIGYSLLAATCASLVGVCARWSGRLGFCSTVLKSRPATYLAKVSYTVYLLHLPVYVLVGLSLVRLLGRNPVASGTGIDLLCGVLATAAMIGVAALSWKYFEAPILRCKNSLFPTTATAHVRVKQQIDPADRVCA